MSYMPVHMVLSFVLEILAIRAFVEILDMCSNVLYVALHVVLFCVSYLSLQWGITGPVRAIVVPLSMIVILPLALSRGPLRVRVFRIAVLDLAIVLGEFIGFAVYSLITHDTMMPTEITAQTAPTIIATYAVILPVEAITLEGIIALCRRSGQDHDAVLETPVLALMCVSLALLTAFIVRLDVAHATNWIMPLVMAAGCFLLVALCVVILLVARHDTHLRRHMANRAATVRQDKHVRDEVRAATRRSLGMRRLRHDLANQMDVVGELVAQGRAGDADRYLAALQEQAHELVVRP